MVIQNIRHRENREIKISEKRLCIAYPLKEWTSESYEMGE